MYHIETEHPEVEAILTTWKSRIGDDFEGYRGHIYRVFNFCLALITCTEEDRRKIAIALCFHDIGLWSDRTVDYIPPSVEQLRQYLAGLNLNTWQEELSLMVEMHHKICSFKDPRFPLVEALRKADLVDFSMGAFRCGLDRHFIRAVKEAIPNAGFHRFLLRGAKDWFMKHPLSMPPFMRW